ncbi:hypothetical protein TNCV_3815581 [Trichonephila clavipes]|nr:hypothetical protein TNCV_3815581 [Trichonephila clavipes]
MHSMVWAGIMKPTVRAHVVANGTMTGQRYCIDEVLLPHVRLFRGAGSVINLFLWTTTQHVIEHFRCSRDCLDSDGDATSRMASAFFQI